MSDTTNTDDTEYMVTTVDNPFNPFVQFDEWLTYDTQMGYHTPSLMARLALTSDDLSEADQALAIQSAVVEIAELNVSGVHRLVTAASYPLDTGQ